MTNEETPTLSQGTELFLHFHKPLMSAAACLCILFSVSKDGLTCPFTLHAAQMIKFSLWKLQWTYTSCGKVCFRIICTSSLSPDITEALTKLKPMHRDRWSCSGPITCNIVSEYYLRSCHMSVNQIAHSFIFPAWTYLTQNSYWFTLWLILIFVCKRVHNGAWHFTDFCFDLVQQQGGCRLQQLILYILAHHCSAALNDFGSVDNICTFT